MVFVSQFVNGFCPLTKLSNFSTFSSQFYNKLLLCGSVKTRKYLFHFNNLTLKLSPSINSITGRRNRRSVLCTGDTSLANIYLQFCQLSADWSTSMSRIKSEELLAPALLCHKEPVRRIQSPLLGALERKIPLGGYFACSSLVL